MSTITNRSVVQRIISKFNRNNSTTESSEDRNTQKRKEFDQNVRRMDTLRNTVTTASRALADTLNSEEKERANLNTQQEAFIQASMRIDETTLLRNKKHVELTDLKTQVTNLKYDLEQLKKQEVYLNGLPSIQNEDSEGAPKENMTTGQQSTSKMTIIERQLHRLNKLHMNPQDKVPKEKIDQYSTGVNASKNPTFQEVIEADKKMIDSNKIYTEDAKKNIRSGLVFHEPDKTKAEASLKKAVKSALHWSDEVLQKITNTQNMLEKLEHLIQKKQNEITILDEHLKNAIEEMANQYTMDTPKKVVIIQTRTAEQSTIDASAPHRSLLDPPNFQKIIDLGQAINETSQSMTLPNNQYKIRGLQNEITHFTAEQAQVAAILEKEREKQNKTVTELENHRSLILESLNEFSNANATLKKQLEQTNQEKQSIQEIANKTGSRLIKYDTTIKNLTNELTNVKHELDEAKKTISIQANSLQKGRNIMFDSPREEAPTQAKEEESPQAIENIFNQNMIKKLSEEILSKTEENKQLKEANNRLTNIETEKDNMGARVSDLNKELLEEKVKGNQLKETLSNLENNLTKAHVQVDAATKTNKAAQDTISEQRTELKKLQEKLKKAEDENSELKTKLSSFLYQRTVTKINNTKQAIRSSVDAARNAVTDAVTNTKNNVVTTTSNTTNATTKMIASAAYWITSPARAMVAKASESYTQTVNRFVPKVNWDR